MAVKKDTFLLWFIVLCFLMGGDTIAASTKEYELNLIQGVQWTNTDSIKVNLSFDGGKAMCGACVIGKTNTTEIIGNVTLDRKNSDGTSTTVKKWNDLKTTGDMLIFNETYYVTTGYTYRLTITSTVYRNGNGETVSDYYEANAS